MTGAAKKAAAPKPKPAEAVQEQPEVEVSEPTGHLVVAPLISVQVGSQVLQFSKGDVLPKGIAPERLAHLEDLGFIAEV